MHGDYDKLRHLLLDAEQSRLDALQAGLRQADATVPERVASEIERGLAGVPSRLTRALGEATLNGLELAVQRKPETVVNAVFPVIGPAIRRALQEAMRQLSADIDRAVNNTLSARALRWRLEAWRSGVPYAQVMLRHTMRWRVEHLFLIQPESGLLLGHLTPHGLPELDADAIAGMFTAIQSFVRDSVRAQEGGIGQAIVGDYQLAVSEGPQARLVAFVRGVPASDFPTRLDELNEALHARHGKQLADHAGVDGAGLLEQAQLDALDPRSDQAAPPVPASRASRRLGGFALAVAAVLLAAWAFGSWRWSRQVDAIGEHLAAQPGLLVTRLQSPARNRLRIEGLRDPLAADVQAWLAEAHPQVDAEWKLRGFLSLEPDMLAARIAHGLQLPAGNVVPPDAQGVARLHGEVAFDDWYRLHQETPQPLVPGLARIDGSALSYPGKPRIDALTARLQALVIPFASGSVQPEADWEDAMAAIISTLDELQEAGGKRMAFRISTTGMTDLSGKDEGNTSLRLRRAQWLAGQLRGAGLAATASIAVDERLAVQGGVPLRGARAIATPVPLRAPSP